MLYNLPSSISYNKNLRTMKWYLLWVMIFSLAVLIVKPLIFREEEPTSSRSHEENNLPRSSLLENAEILSNDELGNRITITAQKGEELEKNILGFENITACITKISGATLSAWSAHGILFSSTQTLRLFENVLIQLNKSVTITGSEIFLNYRTKAKIFSKMPISFKNSMADMRGDSGEIDLHHMLITLQGHVEATFVVE